MRIAVASDGLNVADNFMQSKNFNYYTTTGFEVDDSKNIPIEGINCEEYPSLMALIGIDALICNVITPRYRLAFEDKGITVHDGAQGNALEAARLFVAQQAGILCQSFDEDD